MEFLVHIQVKWPPDGDPAEFAWYMAVDLSGGAWCVVAVRLQRRGRIPGRFANWGIWEAPDADALHAAISSLAFYPYLDATVHPLAAHPSDPGAR